MSNRISERRTPTGAEREAQKAFRQTDAKVALSEYERAQRALHANRERLKAERLARDAEAAQKLKTGFRSNLSSSSNLLG